MFRKMVKADLPQLIAIERAAQGAPWTEETFKLCFDMSFDGWVIVKDERIAGYIVLSFQADECHVLNVCVAREYQHQGLGRSMMEFALAESVRRHVSIVYLEVRRSNSRAIALYRKLHFIMVGERIDYYQTVSGPEDALIFAISLTPSSR